MSDRDGWQEARTGDALLVGCGDLGGRIGRRLVSDGRAVLALRRRVGLVPAPIRGLGVDLTREVPELPDVAFGEVVVCLTADSRDPEAYRRTYVDGTARAVEGLARRGITPQRAVFVSSTAACAPTGDVDETSPAAPARPTGVALLEAEQRFLEAIPHGVVIRLAGLYGPDRSWLVDAVRSGSFGDVRRWVNAIHRDDAAAAVVHLLRTPHPARLYLGVDDEPAPAAEVMAFVAQRLGLPGPSAPDGAPTGKRLINRRLRATGFTPVHPTYREGYADCAGFRPTRASR